MADIGDIVVCDRLEGLHCSGCSHIFEFRETMTEIVNEDGVTLGLFCSECVEKWTATERMPWWAACEYCGRVTSLMMVGEGDESLWLCEDCAKPGATTLWFDCCPWCGRPRPLRQIELVGGQLVLLCEECQMRLAQE